MTLSSLFLHFGFQHFEVGIGSSGPSRLGSRAARANDSVSSCRAAIPSRELVGSSAGQRHSPDALGRRGQTPGHSHRISFSRGVHEVVGKALGPGSTGRLFNCQIAGSRSRMVRKEQ